MKRLMLLLSLLGLGSVACGDSAVSTDYELDASDITGPALVMFYTDN